MKLRLLMSLKTKDDTLPSKFLRDKEMILKENQKEYDSLEDAKAAKAAYIGWAGDADRLDDLEIIIATVDQGE
ncbi:MAG: hypothetical protein WCC97_10845 [Candidatus Acidiferrales bacterium]